jgi:hypothetical protein
MVKEACYSCSQFRRTPNCLTISVDYVYDKLKEYKVLMKVKFLVFLIQQFFIL